MAIPLNRGTAQSQVEGGSRFPSERSRRVFEPQVSVTGSPLPVSENETLLPNWARAPVYPCRGGDPSDRPGPESVVETGPCQGGHGLTREIGRVGCGRMNERLGALLDDSSLV